MSFEKAREVAENVPNKVLDLTGGEKAVLAYFGLRANPETGESYPAKHRVITETGYGRTFVRSAVKHLETLGLLEEVSRMHNGTAVYLVRTDEEAIERALERKSLWSERNGHPTPDPDEEDEIPF